MKTNNFFCVRAAFLSLLLVLVSLNSAPAAGFLHTQGEDIVDEHGQKIILRGYK